MANAAVEALRVLPRRALLLYVNALQSYVWNEAASRRMGLSPHLPIEGDLVLTSRDLGAAHGSGDAAAAGGDAAAVGADAAAAGGADFVSITDDCVDDGGGAEGSVMVGASAKLPAVRVLNAEDIASGLYSLSDVVLPLPGHSVLYPVNGAVDAYAEALKSHGITHAIPLPHRPPGTPDDRAAECAHVGEGGEGHPGPQQAGWRLDGVWDLPGAYRPLIARPRLLTAEVVGAARALADPHGSVPPACVFPCLNLLSPSRPEYTDHTLALEPSDLDILAAPAAANTAVTATTAAATATATAAEPVCSASAPAGGYGERGSACKPQSDCKPPSEALETVAVGAPRLAWKIRFRLPPSVRPPSVRLSFGCLYFSKRGALL